MVKKSDRTRQRILEAANRLFYHQGYNRTSFSDVVKAAGIPRGNIYYYFKTKDDILIAAIDYRLSRIDTMLKNWSDQYRTPIERLKRFLEILPSSVDALTRYGCPMGSLNTELGKDQPHLQSHAHDMFQLFENWLTDQFSELGYAGKARQLSQRLMARGQGISIMAHIHNDPEFIHRETSILNHWLDNMADGDDSCAG